MAAVSHPPHGSPSLQSYGCLAGVLWQVEEILRLHWEEAAAEAQADADAAGATHTAAAQGASVVSVAPSGVGGSALS
jgi:hypothetical protein